MFDALRERFLNQKMDRRRRERTPSVIQMEAVECGAACLTMILAYYGRWEPLDKVRRDCGVSRDGSKASYLVKAAKGYGLYAEGLRVTPQSVKTLRFPLIAFWNLNHFVVVEGFNSKRWYLNDPAEGPRTVTYEEFDRSLSGVALTFDKGPSFKEGGHKPSLINSLKRRATGMGTALTYAILTGLLLTFIGLVIPSFAKIYVDHYLMAREEDWLKALLWVMLLTIFLNMAVTWLQQNILLKLNFKLALNSSSTFFGHLLRLPVDFFLQRYSGEIQSRVALNDRVASLLSGQLSVTMLHCLTSVFFVAVMASYSVFLTAIGAIGAILNLMALGAVSRRRKDLNKRLLQEKGKLIGVTMSGIYMIETLKSAGREEDFFSRWSGYQAKATTSSQELGLWSAILDRVPPFLSSLNGIAVLGFGGILVMQGFLTVGDIIAFQSLLSGFTRPINSLVELGSQLQEMEGDLGRLDDVLANPLDEELAKAEAVKLAPDTAAKLNGKIELKNVSFAYGRFDKSFIDQFSITINPGSRIALVGASGSGKSTLGNLVAGLYSPTSGEIRFDGKLRSEIPRLVMANSLAKVDQDVFLFEGSIRDNIALWNESVTDTAITQAAKDACIHDVISARPLGYEDMILEAGRNFSGGQRQRLEIARALALDPSILILDEATSALDPLTEKIIDDNLRRRGCSCLIIAHRLSTIRDSDEIVVLKGGQVIERGVHEELVALNGYYAELVKDA